MNDDGALAARVAAGDTTAAEALVERYYDDILRYCQWHAPTPALAEDAAQETFLKFLRHIGRYQHRGRCRAFLYQIARHTCIDMARQRHWQDVPLETAAEPSVPDAAQTEWQSAWQLRQMVAALPDPQREVVLLRFGQALTLRVIAAVTGLPLRTVQSRLRAALKRLKRDYEKGEER